MSPTPAVSPRWIAFAAILLLAPLAACKAGDDDVSVSVVAILATDQNDKIDPKLEGIAREIQKTDPTLTGFRIVKKTEKSMAVGARDDFDLGDEQTLRVVVQKKSDKDGRYQLKITPPQMGDVTYLTTCCGKFLPILTPVRNKNNEQLIIGVGVQPCADK
jgi:hypothetical protein